jgi:hypothetical protein
MATVKQIALSIKRTDTKIARITKEIADLKAAKLKLQASLKKAKDAAPKKPAPKKAKKKK